MSLKRTLARNIVSNWMGFAVQAVVAFLLTPFVLARLGDEAYGIWALVTSLTGYYGLLDVGFRAGLTQYLARALARRDFEALNRTASTGLAALGISSGVLLAASLGLSAAAPYVFRVPAEMLLEVRVCLLVIGAITAVQFLFFLFSAVLSATQRYDVSNAIGISTRLLGAGATLVVLSQGGGLIGLSLATAATSLVDYLLRCRWAFRVLPELRLARALINWSSAGELMNFGLWNMLIAGSRRIISYTDAIVIGMFLPISAITPFALAVSLADHFHNVFRPLGPVFFPAFTQADARGDREQMRRMFLGGTKLLSLLTIASAVIAVVFAADFFRLWVGEKFTATDDSASVPVLFWVLLAAHAGSIMQQLGYQVLMSTGRLRLLALLFLGEGVANLALSVALIRPLGLWGVALGTLIPAVVFHVLLQPWACLGALEIAPLRYLRTCIWPVALVGVVQGPLTWWLAQHYDAGTWPRLILGGVWAGALAVAAVVGLGLDANERRKYVVEPLGHVAARLGRRGALATNREGKRS